MAGTGEVTGAGLRRSVDDGKRGKVIVLFAFAVITVAFLTAQTASIDPRLTPSALRDNRSRRGAQLDARKLQYQDLALRAGGRHRGH